METKPARRAGLVAYYTELLERQRSSGVSLNKFAQELGLSPASLYQWRRRLQGMESRSTGPRVLAVSVVRDREAESRPGGMLLSIGERFKIDLSPDFDEGTLVRLLQLLSQC